MEIKEIIGQIKTDFDPSKKTIGVLGCISSKDEKNNLDQVFILELLENLSKTFQGKIIFFERKFKDSGVSQILSRLQDLSIEHRFISVDNLVKKENKSSHEKVYDHLYINEEFLGTDLKIVVTNASVHKHHAFSFPFTCLQELALSVSTSTVDWSRLMRNEAINILRSELEGIYCALQSGFQIGRITGILDCRKTRLTNEHIPFFSKTYGGDVLCDSDLKNLEYKVIKLMGL